MAGPKAPEQTNTPATPGPEAASPAASLQCALSVPASLKVGQPVELTFRLTNTTAQPLFVLSWHTPLEGLKNDFLEVTRAGAELPYQGPMFKRGEPSAESYVTLAPGGSVEGKIDASLAYDFSQPGTYRIAFRGPLMDVATKQSEVPHPLGQQHPMTVQCPAVQTTIAP